MCELDGQGGKCENKFGDDDNSLVHHAFRNNQQRFGRASLNSHHLWLWTQPDLLLAHSKLVRLLKKDLVQSIEGRIARQRQPAAAGRASALTGTAPAAAPSASAETFGLRSFSLCNFSILDVSYWAPVVFVRQLVNFGVSSWAPSVFS